MIYHIGSGHAFFSGIFLIQLAALFAFMKRGRWLGIARIVSACAGVILVAISSTPLPIWFYAAAGTVTLTWLALEGFTKPIHRHLGLALRYITLAVGWLGIALELSYHLMPTIPRLQNPQVFLVGDSLSAGINRETETWPKLFSRSHHVVIHDLSLAGADVATALLQAKRVSEPNGLVLAEIGGNDFGCYIAEYELRGADRAQYGKKLLAKLSIRLTENGVSRAEERELRRYRQFYHTYPQIREALTPELRKHLASPPNKPSSPIRESVTPESGLTGKELMTRLSFTHIAELLAIDDPIKRSFYESECTRGNLGVRELKRQIASLYFERSDLSRDKAKLRATC